MARSQDLASAGLIPAVRQQRATTLGALGIFDDQDAFNFAALLPSDFESAAVRGLSCSDYRRALKEIIDRRLVRARRGDHSAHLSVDDPRRLCSLTVWHREGQSRKERDKFDALLSEMMRADLAAPHCRPLRLLQRVYDLL